MITAETFKKAYKIANHAVQKEMILDQYLKMIKETNKEGIYISLIDILNKKI